MKFLQTGIILCTENYDECVKFYSECLELPIMQALDDEHSKLTCFDMTCGNYLMIEPGGLAKSKAKTLDENPVWLRFNVKNVEETVAALEIKGVQSKIRTEVWGTVAEFTDPDGNVCSLREGYCF